MEPQAPADQVPPDQPPLVLLIVATALAGSPLPAVLSPTVTPVVVPCETLRVATPWRGPLFDLFEELVAAADAPAAGTVGVLVPMRWVDAAPAPELIIVADHVNTRLRGPLTGRRPTSGPYSGGPQPFPSLTGLYQPETIRRAVGRRVYSVVAVAGVVTAAELTPFERRAVAATGCAAVCDCLVDVAVIAALYGFKVAACGVPAS